MKCLLKSALFVSVVTSLLISFSCSEEFLTKEPPGVAAGSVISSPEGVEAVLIGTYSYLRGRSMFGGALCTDWMYGSITSDDSYIGAYSTYPHFERYESTPSHPYVSNRWQDCYNGIARANCTLEQLAQNKKGNNPILHGVPLKKTFSLRLTTFRQAVLRQNPEGFINTPQKLLWHMCICTRMNSVKPGR